MFKYELHCHSTPVSACSRFQVKDMVEAYIERGYNGFVLTNHINAMTFMKQRTSRWKDLMEYYLSDYEEALRIANGRITVLLGAEVHFHENSNDYLLYGENLKEFLLKTEHLMHLGIKKFSPLAKEAGLLLFQAHPFRNGMTITNPNLLDGVEIYNAHPRHDSRNDLAKLWQERYDLLNCAGSDAHEPGDISCGILTNIEIQDSKTLVDILKTGQFEIIRQQ